MSDRGQDAARGTGKPDGERDDADEAQVRRRRLSWVWLIPLASLAIGAWLLWSTLGNRGRLIHITFETAEGLQAGQSQVKYRDVQMGTVESFEVSRERKVVMNVRMLAKAEPFLGKDTQFWVAKPRIFAGDITGLNTVLSGSFIDMAPGLKPDGDTRDYKGLQDPPAVTPGVDARRFTLKANRVGSVSVGSPIFYRSIEVGKVVGWKISGMAQAADIDVVIDAPYYQWVHDDSRFWTSSGIGVEFGAEGVRLRVDSLKAALLGGVSFETPGKEDGKASQEGRAFQLFLREEQAEAATDPNSIRFATYLSGTVGGLSVGAPVNLMGIRVGDVTKVVLQYDRDADKPRVRAEFLVQVDKVQLVGSERQAGDTRARFRYLVEKKGLRVRLKGGNLLTGQKQLAMEFEPDALPAQLGIEGDMPIIPAPDSGGGGIDDLASTATALLAKVQQIPFKEIGEHMNGVLAGAERAVGGPELKDAVIRLDATLGEAQKLVRHVDAGITPLARRLPAIASELQDTLTQIRGLVAGVAQGSNGEAKMGRDLDRLLIQLTDAAQSVRMVADLLSRHPEALILGRTSRGDK